MTHLFRRRFRRTAAAVLACLSAAWLQGCFSSATVYVGEVDPAVTYGAAVQAEPRTFAVVDARTGKDRPLHAGSFDVIEVQGMGDEIDYLAANLERVLRGQGVDIRRGSAADADMVLTVRRFRIRNEDGFFAPFHTFTTFRGDLAVAGQTHPITAYFKNTAWVQHDYANMARPCYYIAMQAVVSEVAAKINGRVFGRKTPHEELEKLVAAVPERVETGPDEGFLHVLALGYTNSKAVVPTLAALTRRRELLVRASAVSALGTLGAADQLELLRSVYRRDRDLARVMAVKSMGDLGTPEARAALDEIRSTRAGKSRLLEEVLALYD